MIAPAVGRFLDLPGQRRERNEIVEFLDSVSGLAARSRRPLSLYLDVDQQMMWVRPSDEIRPETAPEEPPLAEHRMPAGLRVYRVVTDTADATGGIATLRYEPDGRRGLGAVYVEDMERGDRFTLLVHPFSRSPILLEYEFDAYEFLP